MEGKKLREKESSGYLLVRITQHDYAYFAGDILNYCDCTIPRETHHLHKKKKALHTIFF